MKTFIKKVIYAVLIIVLGIIHVQAQFYFNLGVETGIYTANNDFYTVNEITSDIAYMFNFHKQHDLITYYKISHNGPSIGNKKEQAFSERSQDHMVMLKYLYKPREDFAIKPVLSYFKEFYKFGKNEAWGNGLYDFSKYEIGTDVQYDGLKNLPLQFSYRFQAITYPNYDELLTLYLTSYKQTKQIENHNNHFFNLGVSDIKFTKTIGLKFDYGLNYSLYDNKTVLQKTGYEGTELQKNSLHSFQVAPYFQNDALYFVLALKGEFNDSNQNLIFGYNPKDIQLLNNYYDYQSFQIAPGLSLNAGNESSVNFQLGIWQKQYLDRQARNADGEFNKGDLKIISYSGGISYTSRVNRYFSWSPGYVYIKANSNNDFQGVTLYNYNIHYFTVKMNYEY